MESNFDTSYYSSIASSITSDYWEPPYDISQDFETPIEQTLAFWDTASPTNIFPNTPESLSSSIDSGNHSMEPIMDIPNIDHITFEHLESLIFENPEPLPCIDENELQEILQYIENEPRIVIKLDLEKYLEKEFKCIACSKTFKNKPNLRKHFGTKRHKEIVETSEMPDPATRMETWAKSEYDCFVCGKMFGKYAKMVEHVHQH